MSEDTVKLIMSLLQSGATPLFKLRPRRGKDSRLVRMIDTDSRNFYGIFADSVREENVIIAHSSIKHGTFILEEVK